MPLPVTYEVKMYIQIIPAVGVIARYKTVEGDDWDGVQRVHAWALCDDGDVIPLTMESDIAVLSDARDADNFIGLEEV